MTDIAAQVRLTPARRRALLVLLAQHHKGRSCYISNATDEHWGYVSWQSAAWLIEAGLARPIREVNGCSYVRITQAGLDRLAGEAGL